MTRNTTNRRNGTEQNDTESLSQPTNPYARPTGTPWSGTPFECRRGGPFTRYSISRRVVTHCRGNDGMNHSLTFETKCTNLAMYNTNTLGYHSLGPSCIPFPPLFPNAYIVIVASERIPVDLLVVAPFISWKWNRTITLVVETILLHLVKEDLFTSMSFLHHYRDNCVRRSLDQLRNGYYQSMAVRC